MTGRSPLWKQVFDAVDERLSPTIDQIVRSDAAATIVALGWQGRSELDRRAEQLSRQALHLLNLPAGSDVNRLLEHIAKLEREVRDLRKLLVDRENAEYLASLAVKHEAGKQAANRHSTYKRAAGDKDAARDRTTDAV